MISTAAARAAAGTKLPIVAIAGNPNTGKTTLFNRLTGSDHKVGNYPGVTVERHWAKLELPGGRSVEVVDVPGTYSLSARSREEELAIQAVAGLEPFDTPDVVVLVVDATQIARNLYMVLQVVELEIPVIVALNMTDMLRASGEVIDDVRLAQDLGVPVVRMSALRGAGFGELQAEIVRVLERPVSARPGARWVPDSKPLIEDVERVGATLPASWTRGSEARRRALALWALLSLDEEDELEGIPAELRIVVAERRKLAAASGRQIDLEVIRGRYSWIDARLGRFVGREKPQTRSLTERVDHVLLNPVFGFAIFLVLMAIVFQALFSWADPIMRFVESGFDQVAELARSVIPSGLVQEFVTKALIAGVGSVVVFLPQILMLFLFIGILEDTGYMSRVAFLMDRIMRSLGLHGRAFVPMLSGYACAVPAIMATRTMERQRDRTLTMMVLPLMTCSARLPVYTLIIGALFPPTSVFGFLPVQGLLMIGMYVFSTVTALIAAAVLSRTMFKAPAVPLILEMPAYRWPHWSSVVRMMLQRSKSFLTEAGGVILAITIVLWLLLSFPKSAAVQQQREAAHAEVAALHLPEADAKARLAPIDAQLAGEELRGTYAARLGHAFEPTIAPLGFDWKIGVGLIGAFAQREVFVATMGVVYGVGEKENEHSSTLRQSIRNETRADGKPVYTPLVALSFLVFFALACQCMSTLAVVYRETRSWRWPVFMFTYMTTLAWIASFIVYQGGRALGFT